MLIQYFSDIHLEFGWLEAPRSEADVIIAAGDIGVGLDGLSWLQRVPQPVIYVAGNHEYYGGDLLHTQQALVEEAAGSNVHFLENRAVEIDGVRFLGATLWTDYGGGDNQIMGRAGQHMNDYHQIRFNSRPLTPDHLLDVNATSRKWLATALAEPFDGKTVVVTHHAPTLLSWGKMDADSYYRAAYCNELDGLITDSDIDYWVHGHIHNSVHYAVSDTQVVCNPRGYHGYQTVSGFSLSTTVAV